MEILGYVSQSTLSELKNKSSKIFCVYLEPSKSVFTDGSGYFYSNNKEIKIIIPELPEGGK